jgi:hypothetical protein
VLLQLPQILRAVPEQRIIEMQANIGKVWHRYAASYAVCCWALTSVSRAASQAACDSPVHAVITMPYVISGFSMAACRCTASA